MYQNKELKKLGKGGLRGVIIAFMILLSFSFSLTGCAINSRSAAKEEKSDLIKEAEVIAKKVEAKQKSFVKPFIQPKNILDKKVTLSFYNEPLYKILPLIVDNVKYAPGVDSNTLVTLNAEDEKASNALRILLNMSGLTYMRTTEGIIIEKQPLITFRAYNQPFSIVISSMLAGYNYTFKDGAEESVDEIVSADFNEVPLEQALDRLLSPIKLFWKKEGNVFYIFREKEKLFYVSFPLMEQSFDITSSRSGSTTGSTSTVSSAGIGSGSTYNSGGGMSSALSSASASGTVASMSSLTTNVKEFLTKTGKFTVHKETGAVWVRDRADVVNRLGEFIRLLNKKMSRAMHIEGVITQVSLNDQYKSGVDWNEVLNSIALDGALSTKLEASSSSYRKGVFNLSSSFSVNLLDYINAMKSFGEVKIVSKPSLSVTNGAIGSLIVGKTISYVAQSYSSTTSGGDTSTSSLIVKPLQTGLSFYVLPQIIDNEEALLYISPELTSLSKSLEDSEFSSGSTKVQIPEISLKQTQTVVSVKNGDTVLISGLMEENLEDSKNEVHFLGAIPILGQLFKSRDKTKTTTEFALMLTVRW